MNNTQRSVEDIAIELGRKVRIYNSFNDLEEYVLDILKSERREAEKLRQENEALKAQVSGLVGALEIIKHAGYPKYPNVATPYELQKIAIEALSTLSSTFLEIQKAKENVIEAAKKSVDWHMRHSQYHVTDSNLQEALRTLQQAQEKK